MSDFETTPSPDAASADSVPDQSPEADTVAKTEVEAETIEGIPQSEELADVAADLDDIESVLKNLDKDNADFDAACEAAETDGTIADRPALDTYWQTKSKSA